MSSVNLLDLPEPAAAFSCFFLLILLIAVLLKVEVIYKTVLGTITQPVTVVPTMGAWNCSRARSTCSFSGPFSGDPVTDTALARPSGRSQTTCSRSKPAPCIPRCIAS